MTTLKYDIIRSNRKKTATIDLVDGVVSVRVPYELSQDKINGLLSKKLSWIKKDYLNRVQFTLLIIESWYQAQ